MYKVLCCLALAVFLGSCEKVDQSAIVGKWRWDYLRWSEYKADGTVELEGEIHGNWHFDGRRITITSNQLSQKTLELEVLSINEKRMVVERASDDKRFVGLKINPVTMNAQEKNLIGQWASPENAFLRFGPNRGYFDLDEWIAIWGIEGDTLTLYGPEYPRKLSYTLRKVNPDSILMKATFSDQVIPLSRLDKKKDK